MALNIKNQETERLVRELAALKKVSLVLAVSEAVRDKLAREGVERERTALPARLKRSDRLQAFAQEYSKRVKNPIHSWEIDALLYDKDGLPK